MENILASFTILLLLTTLFLYTKNIKLQRYIKEQDTSVNKLLDFEFLCDVIDSKDENLSKATTVVFEKRHGKEIVDKWLSAILSN